MSATDGRDGAAAADLSGVLESATCPLCHTTDATMTVSALHQGADWRCTVCGQSWSAVRLATVAGYAAWESARRLQQRGTPAAAGGQASARGGDAAARTPPRDGSSR